MLKEIIKDLNKLADLHEETAHKLQQLRANKDCSHCEGVGVVAIPNLEDDFDHELCGCTE